MSGRYLLFAGEHYYPCGGVRDLVGDFDDLEEAKRRGTKVHDYVDMWRDDWVSILDTEDMSVLHREGTVSDYSWVKRLRHADI